MYVCMCVCVYIQVNQTGDDKVMLRTKNYSKELSNSRANNSTCSRPITPIIEILESYVYSS